MKIEEIKYIKKNTKSYDLVFSLDNEQINITFNIYAGMIVEQLLQQKSIVEIEKYFINENKLLNKPQYKISEISTFINLLIERKFIHEIPLKEEISYKIIGNGTYFLPNLLIIELTDACNLRCKHCYINEYNNHYLEKSFLKKLLIESKGLDIPVIQYTGGEPFLHPNFVEIIKYTKALGFNIFITTNFSSDKHIEKFNAIKPYLTEKDSIQISIDGLKKYHDNIRGQGAFNKVINNIKMISDYKNKIYISSCVTEEWMYSLDEFISFIVNLNINRFRFSSVLPIGHAANENFAMPFSKWDELLSIFQAKKLKYKDKIEIAIEESTEKHLKNDQTYFKNCGLGSYRVAISSNKIFKPCIMLPDDITQKNYNSILNYLEDQSNNYFNLVFPFCKDCKSCRNKKYCEKCFSVAWDICLKNRKDFNFDNFLNSNVLI